ncbi:hypothetical protein JXC34_00430 [Candidatus Woesearchaeota archaeon]|nr:hypothetical protein [Candidatus Woesearchaeota archaeon]
MSHTAKGEFFVPEASHLSNLWDIESPSALFEEYEGWLWQGTYEEITQKNPMPAQKGLLALLNPLIEKVYKNRINKKVRSSYFDHINKLRNSIDDRLCSLVSGWYHSHERDLPLGEIGTVEYLGLGYEVSIEEVTVESGKRTMHTGYRSMNSYEISQRIMEIHLEYLHQSRYNDESSFAEELQTERLRDLQIETLRLLPPSVPVESVVKGQVYKFTLGFDKATQ